MGNVAHACCAAVNTKIGGAITFLTYCIKVNTSQILNNVNSVQAAHFLPKSGFFFREHRLLVPSWEHSY